MSRSARPCAREILETMPLVMRFIRDQVRRVARRDCHCRNSAP